MAQVIRSPKTYDVIVVGSGAGGGMAAKILTEGGMNVALLEAGPEVHPEKDYKMFVWPYELPHRGIGVGRAAVGGFRGVSRAERIVGHPGRALYVGAGFGFSVVSFAHRGRSHESLGPHCTAIRADRFSIVHA